jgi:hypothetical protein
MLQRDARAKGVPVNKALKKALKHQRFVSFVPTEVNRSNERQEHLRNLVLFYIGAPQQVKRAVESTEKKGNVAAFT